MKISSEDAIAEVLSRLVEHLRNMDIAQAQVVLAELEFDRLLSPIILRRDGQWVSVDLAAQFGMSRVMQTAGYLRACEEAVAGGNWDRARLAAVAAMVRWTGRERVCSVLQISIKS